MTIKPCKTHNKLHVWSACNLQDACCGDRHLPSEMFATIFRVAPITWTAHLLKPPPTAYLFAREPPARGVLGADAEPAAALVALLAEVGLSEAGLPPCCEDMADTSRRSRCFMAACTDTPLPPTSTAAESDCDLVVGESVLWVLLVVVVLLWQADRMHMHTIHIHGNVTTCSHAHTIHHYTQFWEVQLQLVKVQKIIAKQNSSFKL